MEGEGEARVASPVHRPVTFIFHDATTTTPSQTKLRGRLVD